jgi:hypothetical protein
MSLHNQSAAYPMEEQLYLDDVDVDSHSPLEFFDSQEELFNIPESIFDSPVKHLMDVEFSEEAELSLGSPLKCVLPAIAQTLEPDHGKLDRIFNSDQRPSTFPELGNFEDEFSHKIKKRISKAKVYNHSAKTLNLKSVKVKDAERKTRVGRKVKTNCRTHVPKDELLQPKHFSGSPFNYEPCSFETEEATAPTTRKGSKDTNFQFNLSESSPKSGRRISPFYLESLSEHKASSHKSNSNSSASGRNLPPSGQGTLNSCFDFRELSSSLQKSRNMNCDAGSVCSSLLGSIHKMFGKKEEKEQRYLQKVEEVKLRKLNNLLLF